MKNVGSVDRVIRLIVAAVIAYLYFTGVVSGILGTVLLILAIVFALTSFASTCPIYMPFKISTRKNS